MAEFCPCRGVFQRQTPMLVIGSVCVAQWDARRETLQMAPCHWFSTFISCGFPMGSPYDFGVCELVEVLMHAPHSRVWCQTLGLCDSRFYKFLSNTSTKSWQILQHLPLLEVYSKFVKMAEFCPFRCICFQKWQIFAISEVYSFSKKGWDLSLQRYMSETGTHDSDW